MVSSKFIFSFQLNKLGRKTYCTNSLLYIALKLLFKLVQILGQGALIIF